jgi:hypothetical protein
VLKVVALSAVGGVAGAAPGCLEGGYAWAIVGFAGREIWVLLQEEVGLVFLKLQSGSLV